MGMKDKLLESIPLSWKHQIFPLQHVHLHLCAVKKKRKFLLLYKLPRGFGDLLWLVFFIIIIPRVKRRLRVFGAALHDIARRVFRRKKKTKEKTVFKTLCWRRCCCSGRYPTELKRLISGNSMRRGYASASSLSHLDFYRNVCNACFLIIKTRSGSFPASVEKNDLILLTNSASILPTRQ